MASLFPGGSSDNKVVLAKPATVLTTSTTVQLQQKTIMEKANQQLQTSNIYTYCDNFGLCTPRLKLQHPFTDTMYKSAKEYLVFEPSPDHSKKENQNRNHCRYCWSRSSLNLDQRRRATVLYRYFCWLCLCRTFVSGDCTNGEYYLAMHCQ